MSLSETAAIFQRGRAEVNGRGALTSAAFAAAIIQKGTDSGLAEFRRFSLLHTTSAQTFETRLASVHPLTTRYDAAQAEAVSRIMRLRDSLPRDEKVGKGWRYRGVQGPVDHALVRLSETGANEDAWALLDATFAALERCDKNKAFREREPALEPLPLAWLNELLVTEDKTPEIRIALALASLRAAKDDRKTGKPPSALLAYRLGVERQGRVWRVTKNRPLRCVWGPRPLTENLAAVISRRLAESEADAPPPFDCQIAVPLADSFAFLNGETDDERTASWLDRFLLFDWSFVDAEVRERLERAQRPARIAPLRDNTAAFSLLRPLFHAYTFSELPKESENDISATSLMPLCALLSRGDVPAALHAAFALYRAKLIPLADFGKTAFDMDEPVRLLAALVLPASTSSTILHFNRWLQPSNTKGNTP
jgi:CRISPR-associated protein Csx17